mgnify:CR=1 FL=1
MLSQVSSADFDPEGDQNVVEDEGHEDSKREATSDSVVQVVAPVHASDDKALVNHEVEVKPIEECVPISGDVLIWEQDWELAIALVFPKKSVPSGSLLDELLGGAPSFTRIALVVILLGQCIHLRIVRF